jgi:hypothetical protein
MCAPRWDSPAVFSSIMGSACWYKIKPRGRFVWAGEGSPLRTVLRPEPARTTTYYDVAQRELRGLSLDPQNSRMVILI